MNIRRYGLIAAVAAASLTLVSCAANESAAQSGSSDSSLSGTLVGSGASSQQAAQSAWVAAFQTEHPDVTVEYAPEGSGAGRDNFIAGASAFAGSDEAFSEDELQSSDFTQCAPDSDIVEIPAYISPIAVVFNLDGVETLNLDADTLAQIFSGSITRWNDKAIAEQNPDEDLPDTAITAVHRSDDSGTTENVTDYLHTAAPDVWTSEPSGNWPLSGGEGAQGTSGVIDVVSGSPGTIGYADASRASGLGTVALAVGDDNVSYSAEGAASVVDASPFARDADDSTRAEHDLAISLDRDTDASGAYPLVLVSYLIACGDYEDADTAHLVTEYLDYVISEAGQKTAQEAAGTAPISDELRQKAAAAVDSIS